jgi:hypothetical protein
MVLTFKSSGKEERVVIEREPDGRQRVARATQSDHNKHFWNLKVEHPDGFTQNGTYSGDGANVVIALAELLTRSENEFRTARVRGDRAPQPVYDYHRPIGAEVPIVPTNRRG